MSEKEDYLDTDPPISGQNYVCLSFVSPDELIKKREGFQVAKFLQSYAKDKDLDFKQLYEGYENYIYKFSEELQRDFDKDNNLEYVTFETTQNADKTERTINFVHYELNEEIGTGPDFSKDTAEKNAPGFNEQYYLNENSSAKEAVDAGTYVSSLTLDEKDDILITVKKEGFAFNSTYISANDTVFKSPSSLDISMQSLDEGKYFAIEDIYFDNNSYELKEITKEVLVEFAKYLEINNSLVIEVNGFTDNIGDASDNQILSENRSKAVRDLILLQGISESRISYKGFGESSPKSNNNTEKGRAQNRRTEFRIIKK